MNAFLDTNILIGYIFALDYLNTYVKNFFEFESNYYCSESVETELKKVFNLKLRQYQLFFLKLSKFINNFSDYELISENTVHGLINSFDSIGNFEVNEMNYALNVIWDKLSFNENHDAFEVKKIFNDYKNNFHLRHISKKDNLINNMVIVPNHTKKDKKILNMIHQQNLREFLHEADENILFDANEFACKNPNLNLKFVSAADDFINVIDILMDYLYIDEGVNLFEFSNFN